MATTTRRAATEEDLLATPKDGQVYELVDGEIRVSPAGMRHSTVAARLVASLSAFVTPRRLGHVASENAGYRLPSGNVRSPDATFVAAGRFPNEQLPEGFPSLAPDLAAEVVSPGDRARYVLDKVGEYLEAGVRLVWVIDPRAGRATEYRSLSEVREIGLDDALEGGDVLPGYRCPLRDVVLP
jgi:Uma2 family endonuclease